MCRSGHASSYCTSHRPERGCTTGQSHLWPVGRSGQHGELLGCRSRSTDLRRLPCGSPQIYACPLWTCAPQDGLDGDSLQRAMQSDRLGRVRGIYVSLPRECVSCSAGSKLACAYLLRWGPVRRAWLAFWPRVPRPWTSGTTAHSGAGTCQSTWHAGRSHQPSKGWVRL